MNKRQVKKYKKKLLEGVPEGHGVVISDKGCFRHYFNIGEIVEIVRIVAVDGIGYEPILVTMTLECENRFGMRQTLLPNQIVTHDDIRRKKK